MYVIDPSASQGCQSSERALNWNANGNTGAPGPQGPAGTGLTVSTRLVKPSASPIGRIVLGTGKHQLNSAILGLNFASASGGGTGKPDVHDVSVTKKVDKASPVFFKNCVSGAHYKKVTIAMRKAGKGQQEFLKITLTDVVISSYNEV